LLADGEADAARSQGNRLAFRPASRADRDLDPVPGLLRGAKPEGVAEDVRGLRQGVDHCLREAGEQGPVAGDQPHRGPAVQAADPADGSRTRRTQARIPEIPSRDLVPPPYA